MFFGLSGCPSILLSVLLSVRHTLGVPLCVQHPANTMPFQQIIMHALQCQHDVAVHLLFCFDLDLHIDYSSYILVVFRSFLWMLLGALSVTMGTVLVTGASILHSTTYGNTINIILDYSLKNHNITKHALFYKNVILSQEKCDQP